MSEENISWDEATQSSGFVTIEVDKEKKLVLTNVKLEKKAADAKFGAGKVEFIADVVEEDGSIVSDKVFNTTSTRLKQKLRPIFENKKPEDKTKISILQVGEKFNVQYSVRLVE